MPSPRVHVGQGFLHRHVVIAGIDVAIYFGIVSIKGSENITYGCIWEVVNKYYEQQRPQKAALGDPRSDRGPLESCAIDNISLELAG